MTNIISTIINTVITTARPNIVESGQVHYDFDGINMYATIPSWTTLGDPNIYSQTSFAVPSGDATDDVLDSPPITDIGRIGANYHDGFIWSTRLTDNSPMQGENASQGVVTIPDVILTSASITFNLAYIAGVQNLLDGSVPILTVDASDLLVLGANASNLLVDGLPYGGGAITGHMTISVDVASGTLNTIGGVSTINNLRVSQ